MNSIVANATQLNRLRNPALKRRAKVKMSLCDKGTRSNSFDEENLVRQQYHCGVKLYVFTWLRISQFGT
jgi:hypothetical protein